MLDFSSSEEDLVLASKPNAVGSSIKKSVLNKEAVSKILRSVRESEGFHFYLAIGEPTGETAVSLTDFVEKLAAVEVQSVNFHYSRKDFQKWIRETLGDAELALRVGKIGRIRLGIRGEALRSEILRTVKVRLNELKAAQ
jgi:hypothetical protein